MKFNLIEKLRGNLSYHKTGISLLRYLHKIDSSAVPLAVIKAVLDAVFPFIGIFISAEIIDELIASQYKEALVLAGILVGMDFIVGMVLALLKEVLEYKKTMIFRDFITELRKKALDLDYETMSRTEIIDKINFTERMSSMYGGLDEVLQQYVIFFSSVISIITSGVLVFSMCISRTSSESIIFNIIGSTPVTMGIISIMIISLIAAFYKVSIKYDKKEKDLINKHTGAEIKLQYMIGQVFFNYETGKISRIFDMKKMLLENYDNFNNRILKTYVKMCDNSIDEKSISAVINSVFSILSYSIVIIKILTKAISIGSFTKYTGALIQLNANIINIIKSGSTIRRICNYMDTFISFMETKNSMETGSIPIEKRTDNEYEIEFHDVSFHYPGNEEMVLNHVNCKLRLKNKMAIVGRNGSGKSTFIKLLCRLYEPTDGTITLNGIDIRKYNYKEYQSIFGVVFQDFSLFSFPVGENVAASKYYDEDRVWGCLEKSGVDDRIKKMPKMLKTPIYKYEEDGVEISGGEAQKIAIARALYKDAPFVILDEPTAALDPLSEQEIYARFDEMTKDKTSIFISHRMSSCCFCNDIIVFDKGRIVERGSHENLIALNDYYAKLWNAQCRYYA